MADIKVSKEQKGERSGEVERRQEGGMSRRGEFPSLFSMSPREFFSANPFTLMRRLTDEMDRAFLSRSGEPAIWSPAVEVRQKGNDLIVSAELPGLKQDDVKLEVTDEGLIIEGERKHEHEERGKEGYYHSERSYGRFRRLIPLPEDAKVENARATFNNGVLEVSIPVPEHETKRRQIPIESGGATRTAGGGGGA